MSDANLQGYRLSPQQKRAWRLAGLDGAERATRFVVRVPGALSGEALRTGLRRVTAWHDALRTTFRRLPGMMLPVQSVRDGVEPSWDSVDLSACAPAAAEERLASLVTEEAARAFDLEAGPVVRATLVAMPADRRLVVSVPPLCADALSLENLVRDLGRACAGGEPDEPAVSYLQFSEFQNALLEGDEGAGAREAWAREDLKSLRPLRLPFEKAGAGRSTGSCARPLAPGLAAQVGATARALSLPVAAVLLAAWQTLLWRLSGEDEVSVASLYDGRAFDVLRGAVGLFARWLPVTVRLERGLPFREVAARAAAAQGRAEEAADGFLWGETDDGPVAGRELPALGFEALPWPACEGSALELCERAVCGERCDLGLACRIGEDAILTELRFDAARFDREDVERALGHLHRLLAAAVADPDRPADELCLLDEDERRRLVVEHNDTGRAFDVSEPFHRLFERQARRVPDAPAVVCGDTRLSYRELDERANRLARHLRSLGVGPEVPVALCLERSWELLAALLAVWKAGGAFVPLEPQQPRKRLAFMLEDVGAPVLVTRAELEAGLPATGAAVVRIDADRDEIAGLPADGLEGGATGGSLAYVIFTSGSTGRPKGVLVEHRQLVNYTRAVEERVGFPDGASFATVSTFAADLGHTMIFPALASGGCLHILPPERAADAAAVAEEFERHGIDCLKIVPSHLEALLEAAAEPARVLPRQRLVLGGEALRPGTVQRVREAAPGCEVFNHYGPSETTVGVLAHPVRELSPDGRRRLVPLGSPLANCRVYLVDAQGAPVPVWVAGELCIAGDGVSRGYLGRPDLTAERFVPDPFSPSPGGRMYRTGDLARHLPEGVVEFLGRLDHQVKYHGFRVELEEIRSALNRHPQVRDSIVTLKPDKEGRDVLLAYYVSRQEIDPHQLREHLSEVILEETLPSLFVHLKRLPLTLNGKVSFAALPAVEEAQKKAQRPYVAPRTPTEEILAGIWAAVLGLERVSAGDNFFELGGHSLLATQVASRVRQSFQVELPLRALFEAATLAHLAARVDGLLAAGLAQEVPPMARVPRDGGLPLSFAQERLWFMDRLSPGNPAYNMHVALRMSGRLDRPAFELSLRQTVDRHEALRTRFLEVEGRPVQVAGEAAALSLPRVDLRGLDPERQEAEMARRIAAEARQPFDLASGRLMRALLFRLAEEEHVVLFVLHHIAADGWSLGLLVRELADAYQAWSAGRPPAPRELPIQYADYAVWQRRWLQGEELERQLSYWERRLRGAPEVLELPGDRPRPVAPTFRGAHVRFELPAELSRALRELSRREGVTLFMSLLAVFDLLLARYTEREDIVVGTDVANRNRLETEGLIGFLVNNLVLRTDLSGDPTFRELLHRVRETTLGAYAHQDLPFDLLVKTLRPRRHLSHTPLFQVLFVVQNAPVQLDLPGLRLAPLTLTRTTAKFDLAVFVREQGELVTGSWNYSRDLFDEDTVQRMAGHFEKLLQGVCARPEARLSELEMFAETERRRLAVQRDQRVIAKANKLRSTRRATVDVASLEVVKTGFLGADGGLPVVMSPQGSEPVSLVEWARHNRPLLDEHRLRHGGILFRGFDVGSVPGFERFAGTVCDELYADYGDLPSEEGGEKVYRSTPYPSEKMILFHNESSHLDRWPSKQLFFCVTAAASGGETPIVDCREVYRRLDPEVAAELERRKLMYVRNFTDGLDVSWRQFFRTEDPAVAERKSRDAEMEIEWKKDGLRTRKVCDAVIRHPATGEKVFFNQVQLHHLSCMDPGMRASMLAVFDGKDLPRDVRYGDGAPIGDDVMAHVSEVYRDLAVSFPWQEGDILMLDNMLVAHARNPFSGPRKIVVAMGEMVGRADLR